MKIMSNDFDLILMNSYQVWFIILAIYLIVFNYDVHKKAWKKYWDDQIQFLLYYSQE